MNTQRRIDHIFEVAPAEKPFDTVSFIMAYEGGELDEEEVISGFQHLIDNGLAWQLQGHYGRTASALIDQGLCSAPAGGE